MAKTDKDKWNDRNRRNQSSVLRSVERQFKKSADEAARIASALPAAGDDRPFSFDDYPMSRERVSRMLEELHAGLQVIVVNGINSGWTLANDKNDELSRQVFGDNIGRLTQEQYRRYFSNNDKAREAFIRRKVGGLSLSDRVWRYTGQFKEEIEIGLEVGIRNGLSADEMARELKAFLQYPDKLFRRVRDELGNLRLSKAAAAFHPGRGVYRSSYKNARRLAATETNIAYMTADHERWQQMDFVVGIRIELSYNHTLNGQPFHDICDTLGAPAGSANTSGRGCYPKDFKFTGWHPHCRCHAVTILKTEEEIDEGTRRILAGEKPDGASVNRVDDVPEEFKRWVQDNRGRMERAKSLPYFLRENGKYVAIQGQTTPAPADEISKALGITRGKPMTFEEANALRGNPHYAENEQFRVNCQSCVVANELRRRGWDVEAYGNLKQTNYATYALSFRTEAAWVDADGNIPTKTTISFVKGTKLSVDRRGKVTRRNEFYTGKEVVQMVNDSTAEVGRYHISWAWTNKRSGHIITAERLPDGALRFYDPQNGKLSGIDFTKIDKLHGINILRVDNLRPNIDVVRGVVKKSGTKGGAPVMPEAQRQWWKDKAGSKAVTGDNLGDLMRLMNEKKGSERLKALKEITAAKEFKKVDGHPNVFSVIGKETPDYNNLLACADKMADKGFEVYLLPSPGKARTPDFIVKRKGFTATYEVKTITGKSSAGARLLDSGGQSDRVILNMNADYNPRLLAKDIKKHFENNENAREVLILKRGKLISVTRSIASSRKFERTFINEY